MPHQHKFPAALRQRAARSGLVIQIEAAVRQTKMDALDVELYPAVELHRRAGDVELRGFERIDFHCMLYVISGRYLHVVDFDMLDCARGSIVVLQPGQVHRFGDLSGWDGWLLIFRSGVPPPPATAHWQSRRRDQNAAAITVSANQSRNAAHSSRACGIPPPASGACVTMHGNISACSKAPLSSPKTAVKPPRYARATPLSSAPVLSAHGKCLTLR